jgi:hypothetical protein
MISVDDFRRLQVGFLIFFSKASSYYYIGMISVNNFRSLKEQGGRMASEVYSGHAGFIATLYIRVPLFF